MKLGQHTYPNTIRCKPLLPRMRFLLWALLLLAQGCHQKIKQAPVAQNGEIDLSGWNFDTDGAVALSGEWEFYWLTFVNPGYFKNLSEREKQYFPVPSIWNNHKLKIDGNLGKGYATYRLKVNDIGNHQGMALQIPAIYSSYKLWVNGILLAENGQLSDNEKDNKGLWLPVTEAFALELGKNNVEIIWQIANYKHKLGGIGEPIILHTIKPSFAQRNAAVTASMILVGGCFTMALFFFVFFFFFKRDLATLYFASICFTWAVRPMFSNLYLIHFFFPGLSWQWATKIEYYTVYATVYCGLLFIVKTFGKERDKYVVNYLLIVVYIFATITLATPTTIFSHLLLPFQVFSILVICYVMSLVIKAIKDKRQEAWLSVVGVFLAVAMFAYEIFATRGILTYDAIFISVGYLIVFLLNSLVLGYRYTKSRRKILA